MSHQRMQALLVEHGYALRETPGLVTGDKDGHTVSLFTWGSDKWADVYGIPRKYLCVRTAAGDWRIPMVVWVPGSPIKDQLLRLWSEVAEEFASVFVPAFELPLGDQAELLNALGERYEM